MRILVYEAPKKMHHEIVEDFPMGANDLRVKTLYSGVSHGTEMGVYRNLVPQFSKINDPNLHLLLPADKDQTWTYPLRSCDPGSWGLGYSNVGRVIEKGENVTDFEIGDIVYSASPHQTQVVKDASEFTKIPSDIDPKYVIVFFNLNTTYNAILDAKIKLGDVVVISGLGLLGQLCAQMAKMSGASRVYGIDTYEKRRKMAEVNGCDATFNPAEDGDIALKIRKLTNNRGADVVMEVSGNTRALNEAIRIAAPDTTVTVVSWYQSEAKGLYLADEFHHNRIAIRQSQSAHINPAFSHTYDLNRRNEICMEILRKLSLDNLLTIAPYSEAPKMYKLIDEHAEEVIQVVFSYEEEE